MLRRLLLSAVAIAAVSPAFAAQYRINRCASIQGNDTWMLAFDQQNNKVNFWREDEDHGVHFGLYTVETNGDVTMDVGNKPAVHITMHSSGFTAWRSGDSKGTMNCVYADDTDIQPVSLVRPLTAGLRTRADTCRRTRCARANLQCARTGSCADHHQWNGGAGGVVRWAAKAEDWQAIANLSTTVAYIVGQSNRRPRRTVRRQSDDGRQPNRQGN